MVSNELPSADFSDIQAKIHRQQALIEAETTNKSISNNLLNKLKSRLQKTQEQLTAQYSQTDYQGWRGIWATILITHYPTMQLCYEHEHKKLYDIVITNDKPAHKIIAPYHYKPLLDFDYDYVTHKRTEREIGKQISFEIPMYFKHAHTSDIYRQSCYYISSNQYYYCIFNAEQPVLIHLSRYFTPLNQTANDYFITTYLCSMIDAFDKQYIPLFTILSQPEYPYNAYTQYILASGLFSPAKEIRLASLHAIVTAISQFKFDPEMFASHSQQLIQHHSAPFNRYLEGISQLAGYDRFYQAIVLEVIEKTLNNLTFDDKLPTGLKRYIELYYQLLSNLQRKPSESALNQLEVYASQSASLKPIVNKIKKI